MKARLNITQSRLARPSPPCTVHIAHLSFAKCKLVPILCTHQYRSRFTSPIAIGDDPGRAARRARACATTRPIPPMLRCAAPAGEHDPIVCVVSLGVRTCAPFASHISGTPLRPTLARCDSIEKRTRALVCAGRRENTLTAPDRSRTRTPANRRFAVRLRGLHGTAVCACIHYGRRQQHRHNTEEYSRG